MTAKQYLQEIRKTNKKILAILNDLSELRCQRDGLKSVEISEKVQSSKIYMDRNAVFLEREEKLISECKKIEEEWWHCRKMICRIKDQDEQDILRYYYLKCKKWNEVAEKIHISERNVYTIHGRALESFREIYEKNQFCS